jgi:hypothetical protein
MVRETLQLRTAYVRAGGTLVWDAGGAVRALRGPGVQDGWVFALGK